MENSKGRDVIIVLDGEDSKTTTLKTETPTKISGTWSAQDALKALKKVGIDDSFPASEYDLMVKPSNLTGRKKKNAKRRRRKFSRNDRTFPSTSRASSVPFAL